MALSTDSGKVLIIGAGLGGLVLAQILQKNKVPYEIFERDNGPHGRKQGWAVALIECLPDLRELLPQSLAEGLTSNSVNVNTGEPDEIGFTNANTGEKYGVLGGKPVGQPGAILRVSREHFRDYLWDAASGLTVQTNKQFTHYDEDANGVTAHFADGSTARGTLLIGADGAHSRVLDQLIGKDQHVLTLSKMVPIFYEGDVPPSVYEPIRRLSNAVLLAMSPDLQIQIGMMSMEKDRSSAHFFWVFTLRREEPRELSDWVQHATREQLHEFVVECTKDMHPFVKDLVQYAGPEATAIQTRFLEFEPPEVMPAGRVSVLGDAAHCMIPLRGAGANSAILDACDLGRSLVHASKGGADLSGVLPAYHELMIPRGRYNVQSSRAAGEIDEKHWLDLFRRPE